MQLKKLFNPANFLSFSIISLIIILFVFSQILLFSKGFFAISADEAGHTLEAYAWYKGDAGLYSIWLPFQKVFYGMIFKIHYDLIWVPRILSSIFGLLTLISLMLLSYELFQDKIISIFTGFLGSIFWGIVLFSVLPLTEIYFTFFIMSSLTFLLNWRRKNNDYSLWLALALSAIANTVRYEAWVFSFCLYCVVVTVIYKGHLKLFQKTIKIIGITLILFSFPAVWIYISYTLTGNPAGFINSVAERYTFGKALQEIQNNVVYSFFYINLFSLNIVGLISIIFFYKKSSAINLYTLIFFTTLLIMGIVTFVGKVMPTHNSWRLVVIWSVLLLPFTAYWLFLLFENKSKFLKLNFAFFLIILIYFFTRQTMNYSAVSYMTKEDMIIGEYINETLLEEHSDSKIFIEKNGWEYSNLLICTQQPDRFIIEKTDMRRFSDRYVSPNEKMTDNLENLDVKFLILKLSNIEHFDSSEIHSIKQFNRWTIYGFE